MKEYEHKYPCDENSCDKCKDLDKEKKCKEFPAMVNQIRCIKYIKGN